MMIGGCECIAATVIGVDAVLVLFCKVERRQRNKWTYRVVMLALSVSFCAMGFVTKTYADIGVNGVVGVVYVCFRLPQTCLPANLRR